MAGPQYGKDQYGRPMFIDLTGRAYVDYGRGGFEAVSAQQPVPPPPGIHSGANMITPGNADLAAQAALQANAQGIGGGGQYANPFYPTAPRQYLGSGKMVRDYSTGLLSTDADYVVGTEAIRNVLFSNGATIIAITGGAFSSAAGNAFPIGLGPLDVWLFRMQYSNGELLAVNARIASNVVGDAKRPGQVGFHGWTIQPGQAITIGITPLLASLRIDVTLVVLEQMGASSYSTM